MTKQRDTKHDFLKEAERIEQEEIQIGDEEAQGRWVFVRPRPAKEPSQVYSIRLPATVVAELRVLATARGEAPTGLIRDWVLERLDEEIDRLPRRTRKAPPGFEEVGGSSIEDPSQESSELSETDRTWEVSNRHIESRTKTGEALVLEMTMSASFFYGSATKTSWRCSIQSMTSSVRSSLL